MKKHSLLIPIISFAILYVACKDDEDLNVLNESSTPTSGQAIPNKGKTQKSSNLADIDWAADVHNEAMAIFYDSLSGYFDTASTVMLGLDSVQKYATKYLINRWNDIGRFGGDTIGHLETNLDDTYPLMTEYTGGGYLPEVESNLNADQKYYLNLMSDILLNEGYTYTQVVSKFDSLQLVAEDNLTAAEYEPVYSAFEVASHSMDYWYNKMNDWINIDPNGNNGSTGLFKKWRRVADADFAGAVAGTILGWFSLGAGTAGTAAGASLTEIVRIIIED